MKPILKWPGGKRQLLHEIKKLLPKDYGTYFEPMVGAGALFFELMPKKAFVSDMCPQLISFYDAIAAEPHEVIQALHELVSLFESDQRQKEKFYYRIRNTFNTNCCESTPALAAQMLFLNKTCFNGLWRVNKSGKLNSPFGHYKSPSFPTQEHILGASKALHGVTLKMMDYGAVGLWAESGDFCYFDPPYMPLIGKDSFVSYTAEGFAVREHGVMVQVVDELTSRGVKVMVSNSDTAVTRESYKNYHIHQVYARRSINRDGNGRGKVGELIITNYKGNDI